MSGPVPSRRASRRTASESNSVNGKIIYSVDSNVESDASFGSVHMRGVQSRTDGMATSQSSVILGRHSSPRHSVAPINVEEIDDEVQLLSSSRNFQQIRPRKNRNVTVILDDERDVLPAVSGTDDRTSWNGNSRHRAPTTRISVINSEERDRSSNPKRRRITQSSEPPKEEPSFKCTICWDTLKEETSTTCGHIFCNGCIKAAIQAQKKCPTCRRSLTMKQIHRVYLPVAK